MRPLLLAGLATAVALQAQPKVQRFTLPNGLRVVHLEDHERPLVRARLHVNLEPADTPSGRQGLPQLVMRMLSHSDTADLKADVFDRMLEDSGIQFTHSLEQDGMTWQFVARSRDQDRAMGLLVDRLARTVFDPSILEIQRLACWRDEERLESSPHLRLRQLLVQDPSSRPTLAGLGAITLEDLLTFQARVLRPDRAVLILHGDLGLEQAKRLVLLSLGSWTTRSLPSGVPASAGAKSPSSLSHLEVPKIPVTGTSLRIQAAAVRPDDLPEEVSALLGLLIPGEAALSPVRVAMDRDSLVAILDAEAGTAGAAAGSLLYERLAGLRLRGFTQSDLDRARVAWLARRSLETLHSEAQMDSALAEARGHGVSEERVKAVSLAVLNAGLKRWLDPARIRSGAVGDPEVLKALPLPRHRPIAP